MILSELLAELRENILNDRSDRVEGSSDYLWTDATLIRYIDEAQRRLARLGLVIRDATTPSVARVTLTTGQETYPLHEAVVAVVSAKMPADTYDLRRAGHSMFDAYRPPDMTLFDAQGLATNPGKPLAFSTDEEVSNNSDGSRGRSTLRLYPAPSVDYNGVELELRVMRMPIMRLAASNLKGSPEVPEEHHLDMLDWAAYLALRIDDIDAGADKNAETYRVRFDNLVREARRNAMRKLYAPTMWRFGTGGYVWES